MKEEKKYAMIQIPAEIHQALREHCKKNGFKIGSLVSILVKKHLRK